MISSRIHQVIRMYTSSYVHLGLSTLFFMVFSYHALDYPLNEGYIKSIVPAIIACYCYYKIYQDTSLHIQSSKIWLKRWMWINIIISVSYTDVWNKTLWWLIIPVIITVAYIHPYVSSALKIRQIPFLKNLLIGLCFSMVTAAIPLLDTHADTYIIGMYSAITFTLYLVLSVLFDIRDAARDILTEKSNIASILGISKAKTYSYMLIGIMVLMALWLTNGFIMDINHFGAFSIMTVMLGTTIWKSKPVSNSNPDTPHFYYDIWAESLPAVPFFIALVV